MKINQVYKSIIKYPISTLLNVLSLVIAFSGIISIMLYVSYEKSFDKHHENYDQIYSVLFGKEGKSITAAFSPVLRQNVPNISAITPVWFRKCYVSKVLSKNKDDFHWVSSVYAKNDVFDIFTHHFIFGDKTDALSKTKTVVLTKSLSNKIFGDANPVGETITIDKENFLCTGVIDDLPETSSIKTECFISYETLLQQENSFANRWNEWSFMIFIKINKAENYENVRKSINDIEEINERFNEQIANNNGEDLLYLQPIKDFHYSGSSMFVTVSKTTLSVLQLLAFILAIMGMVNFINLLSSQAMQRARVYSIKRILGASRLSVIFRIIIESIIISLFAFGIALLLHSFLYPYLENLLQISHLDFGGREHWYFYFIVMTIVYAVMVSIYPAFYITSVDVSQSMKGSSQFSGSGKTIRNTLLVLQFAFTIILIIGSIAIEKQISYWHNFDIGIQKENVIYLRTTQDIRKHHKAFAQELIKHPNITEFTYSRFVPGGVGMNWGRTVEGQNISVFSWPVDNNFLDFFDIEIIDGRNFSKNAEADKNAYILNQTAVKEFGWDKPTEKTIFGFRKENNVIGVARDIHFASLKDDIQPMLFWLRDNGTHTLMLKVSEGNYPEVISHIEKTWNTFEKNVNFNYRFLDDSMNDLYKKEEGIAYFIEFVALWCILLSITGLLGLAIFIARQRTKEIGIRRTNGASIRGIVFMLNNYFLRWIVIASVLAIPVAYFAINEWMANFAYRTEISWWIFAFAALLTLIISMLAVSIQAYRVARKNPVEALRYE
jgi:putative ABC transport system permease protein